MQQNLQTI